MNFKVHQLYVLRADNLTPDGLPYASPGIHDASGEYGREWATSLYDTLDKAEAELLGRHSQPGRLLEIGCASGWFLEMTAIKQFGWNATGVDRVDFSDDILNHRNERLARKPRPIIEFINGDINDGQTQRQIAGPFQHIRNRRVDHFLDQNALYTNYSVIGNFVAEECHVVSSYSTVDYSNKIGISAPRTFHSNLITDRPDCTIFYDHHFSEVYNAALAGGIVITDVFVGIDSGYCKNTIGFIGRKDTRLAQQLMAKPPSSITHG